MILFTLNAQKRQIFRDRKQIKIGIRERSDCNQALGSFGGDINVLKFW